MNLIIFTLIISTTNAAHILGIFPLPVKSHFVMFDRLLRGLAEKGHTLDVITPFPPDKPIPRYNAINMAEHVPVFTSNMPIEMVNDLSFTGMVHFMTVTSGFDICQLTLQIDAIKELRDSKKKYDLLITETFGNDCMYGFGHLFDVPSISMISSVALPWVGNRIGNPDSLAFIPNYYAPFDNKMSLGERLYNTITHHMAQFYYYIWSSVPADKLSASFYGFNSPTVTDLAKNTSLIFVNSHFSFSNARPLVPNFIEIGGIHINEPKKLSQHFEQALQTNLKGVIYLTMGSMIMTETFDTHILQGMFNAFAKLPYKVLWKGVLEKFPKNVTIPKNIHFEPWMPQTDILCHPNVKLFVSHGGLMGTQESVYCGVPILGIPIFADQQHNMYNFEHLGMAITVPFGKVNEQAIFDAATKLLTQPSYSKIAQDLSIKFKDRPMSPLDTAIYWTEYVLRHKGAPHLRVPGADLPWYQLYLIDVYGILIGTVLIAMGLMIYTCKVFLKCILCRKSKNKIE